MKDTTNNSEKCSDVKLINLTGNGKRGGYSLISFT